MTDKHILVSVGDGRSYDEYRFPMENVQEAVELLGMIRNDQLASKSGFREKMSGLMGARFCVGSFTFPPKDSSPLSDCSSAVADAISADEAMNAFMEGGFVAKKEPSDEAFAMRLGDPSEYAIGESICDPLQDAIGSTEIACRSAQGETLEIMQNHLKALLLIQLAKELSAADLTIDDIQMRGERKS